MGILPWATSAGAVIMSCLIARLTALPAWAWWLIGLTSAALGFFIAGFVVCFVRVVREGRAANITLLSVDFGFQYNMRGDLGNPITIFPTFRNDHGTPVAVRAIRWQSRLSAVSSTLVESGMALRDSADWLPRRGSDTVIVPPQYVFRASVETQHASRKGLALLRDKHALGTLTLLVDGKEAEFTF